MTGVQTCALPISVWQEKSKEAEIVKILESGFMTGVFTLAINLNNAVAGADSAKEFFVAMTLR